MIGAEMTGTRGFVARNSLAVAFCVSVVIHLGLFGTYRLGQRLHWWDHQATWLLDWQKKRAAALPPKKPTDSRAESLRPKEIPLTFIEIDPALAQTEAPKDAKYYSSLNAKAANPDATVDANVPKSDGQQTKIDRFADVPKPKPLPAPKPFDLQPTPPPETAKPPTPDEVAESKPKPAPAEKPGDLVMIKPAPPKPPSEEKADATVADTTLPPRQRPRTLEQARAEKGLTLAGLKKKQDGGVRAHGQLVPDTKQTPFGSYDYQFIKAVEKRWYDLLESHNFPQRSGKVVLEFKLNFDGRISDMKVNGNEVGDMLGLLCERAVLDPSPFGRWPSDMRRAIPGDFREVTFTFFYN